MIPLEDLAILLARILSGPLKKKLNNYEIKFFQREGIYYARYNGEVIFEGDKAAASKFLDEIEAKEGDDIKKILDDLLSKRKRKVRAYTQADVKIIEQIRKKYGAGKKKNAAFAKGEIGGDKIDLESISGGELAPWSQKGNFNPPKPKEYSYNKGPEPYKE